MTDHDEMAALVRASDDLDANSRGRLYELVLAAPPAQPSAQLKRAVRNGLDVERALCGAFSSRCPAGKLARVLRTRAHAAWKALRRAHYPHKPITGGQ